MQGASIAKDSFVSGMHEFTGKLNQVMNKAIIALCKVFPLRLLTFPKAHMVANGASNLYDLKSRIIINIAENLVRYDLICTHPNVLCSNVDVICISIN